MRNSHNSHVKKKEQRNKQRFDQHSSTEHQPMANSHTEILKVVSIKGVQMEMKYELRHADSFWKRVEVLARIVKIKSP